MIICDGCFHDKEISSIIKSVSRNSGICPTCHKHDKKLYDTDYQNDLTPYFEDLVNTYTPEELLPPSFPAAEKRRLMDDLNERWQIFSDIPYPTQYEILRNICSELYASTPSLFDGLVGIPELYDDLYLKNHMLLRTNNWDLFVNEIKTVNRYHSKLVNLDILEKYCSFIRKTYKAGYYFYRARISEKEGFDINSMGAPPAGKSSEGRANARGITCLYLASDLETTLHEVRAGVFDFVSIGKFLLKKDIVVVDLSAITEISPFTEGLDCLDHAINMTHLKKINDEMSKSLRRSDSTLDYVPTQYIVDFIKSIEHNGTREYAGVEYSSTTNPDGYNLAIFEPELFECIAVDVYNIEELRYKAKKI